MILIKLYEYKVIIVVDLAYFIIRLLHRQSNLVFNLLSISIYVVFFLIVVVQYLEQLGR